MFILASCEHNFIRVHENLVQLHSSNNISIIVYRLGTDEEEEEKEKEKEPPKRVWKADVVEKWGHDKFQV